MLSRYNLLPGPGSVSFFGMSFFQTQTFLLHLSGSLFTKIISAVSAATSVPLHTVIPTSVCESQTNPVSCGLITGTGIVSTNHNQNLFIKSGV